MRHRIYGKQLNRTSAHRTAMMRNMAAGLFEHGQIETTLPKAKAVQGFAEKLITIAKTKSLHSRRQLESKINDRNIFAWADDPQFPEERKDNAVFEAPDASEIKRNRFGDLKKSPRLIEHLLQKVAPMFEGRDGGYTRIVKLDKHRLGDGSDLVLVMLVGNEDGPQVGGGVSGRRRQADKRTAFAEKLTASMTATATAEEAPAEEAPAEEAAAETPETPETPENTEEA
ncbi:50S ribosomal protein L17 [Phycisphaerales bacterium]|nr:50S ribosomal protein L17 [Phycisphaerales bacterium]RPG15088.1 MAG: 50S ribosomal protein L17 [Phycisphaera sp. TMED9]